MLNAFGLVDRRKITLFCALAIMAILTMQLVAATAWTADSANQGPSVVILQLSDDADTDWAVADLIDRLSIFVDDDPYIADRLVVRKTSDPTVAVNLYQSVVVYMSHGGPFGIVTGNRLTSWKTMADIVTESSAKMHLFAACDSRNIINYGSEDSGKKLYTVPGARPAEVTNVEITSTVMLALGFDAQVVEEYRISELTAAKALVQSGRSVHIMDFEQIILSEIEAIDASYSDTYTSSYRVYRKAVEEILTDDAGFIALPDELKYSLWFYYSFYTDYAGVPYQRLLDTCYVTYTKNYYYEAWWIEDPAPPLGDPPPLPPDPNVYSSEYMEVAAMSPGHWEYGPDVFTGGTYAGFVIYEGDPFWWEEVIVNVTASGPALDAEGKTVLDSMSLSQDIPRGFYVQQQKVDEVWQSPVVGRNPGRTGGLWTDPAVKADYEYDPTCPSLPGTSGSSGDVDSTGEFMYFDSIPTGSGWHGPSFVRTLPSYFQLRDFGSFSANLSLVHDGTNSRRGIASVSLLDEAMNLVATLGVRDTWGSHQWQEFFVNYYYAGGGYESHVSYIYPGETTGIVTIWFNPMVGIYVDVPSDIGQFLVPKGALDLDRLIKYVAVQSYRYGSAPEHDERIYNVRLSYAGSEYTVFEDNCNDMDEFHRDLAFSNGVLEVPDGESYMTWTSIDSGSGWHGPQYVHTLDRPFRLYQLSEFSVLGELIQGSAAQMGITSVALLDNYGETIMAIEWGDDISGWNDGWFRAVFYPENGGQYTRTLWYGEDSHAVTISLWWDPATGQGSIYTSSSDVPYNYLLHAVYNATRVVQSMVIEGLRYSNKPLLEMRIHDILLETDLTRHDPNNPTYPPPSGDPEQGMEFDGTEQGLSPRTQADVDSHLSDAAEEVETEWTGPWPLLHFLVVTQAIFHMAVDLLGETVVYESDSMGLNEEDFGNAKQVWAFMGEIALWIYALIMICAVAEKIPTGWFGIVAVVGFMGITLGLAWIHSHLLVDNGIWTAGAAAWFFLVLGISCFCIAAGLKTIGGVGATVILKALAFAMKTTFEVIKAAIQFTVWSKSVFVILGVLFSCIYYPHFYNYGG
ncbi:MAG: hypothetical protein EAX95_02080 [Candidatus Thorarchaeota archaeon]|nr:hypothetical protein [Candidatus Thorarchaeota archaeon]